MADITFRCWCGQTLTPFRKQRGIWEPHRWPVWAATTEDVYTRDPDRSTHDVIGPDGHLLAYGQCRGVID